MPSPPRSPLETLMERFVEDVVFPRMEEVFDQMTKRLTPVQERKRAPRVNQRQTHTPKSKPKSSARPGPGPGPAPPPFTLYTVLEISPRASAPVIAAAYKALAKRYHPDLPGNRSKRAEEMMKEINHAFEVLGDAEKRKAYDRSIGL